jgi:hypothetical protein
MPDTYTGGVNPVVTYWRSWDTAGVARAAGRRMVRKYGTALERLADETT